ncbi:SGNH/GDSL hydrolase family protein [Maribacter sp.]|uniref:SGNH/GDSL hydrolase family protein n=1 Tax=Maribacter sp. TaxID=1897614 RepID=UPI0025C73337|nr:SGNH/GDSL hydrolase family protein [Maribacter sp.]
MKKNLAILALTSLFFASCSNDDDAEGTIPAEPTPVTYTSGSADFSNYVSVGNSLTAGYSDSALFIDGQVASYPNMLASNFKLVGGGEFNIPFMADNLGGATLGGTEILGNRLFLDFSKVLEDGDKPSPEPVDGTGTTEISTILSGSFNNMGVPGAKSYHLLVPGYGNVGGVLLGLANPYFVRFASSPGASVLGDAVSQNPTFFSLWIGNNDILGYATSGGDGVNQLGNPVWSTYGSNDITDPTAFAGIYSTLLQELTAGGAKGVVANLPDVTTIPYFTTVPHNPVPLNEATATLLNGAYAQYNGGLAQLQLGGAITSEELAARTISFAAGATNAVVLIDESLTDLTSFNPALVNMRQATADDLIVLTARSFIGSLADPSNPTSINGVAIPLADKWVLTPDEQDEIAVATTAFNQTISDLATQFDLAFVDANTYLTKIATEGQPLSDGSTVTATYGTGGGFSLDGVHPSPRGYALLSLLFIDAINTKYGSDLPGVNPLEYKGLYIN